MAVCKYYAAPSDAKAHIDYAFNAFAPKPVDKTDVRQVMIQTWLKARLMSYDEKYPFQFDMYDR